MMKSSNSRGRARQHSSSRPPRSSPRYVDSLSKHYDRTRIQKELDNFFTHFDDDLATIHTNSPVDFSMDQEDQQGLPSQEQQYPLHHHQQEQQTIQLVDKSTDFTYNVQQGRVDSDDSSFHDAMGEHKDDILHQRIDDDYQKKSGSEPQEANDDQSSAFDGFSIIQNESPDDQQYYMSSSTNLNNEPPGLLMLSMDSNMTQCDDTMASCRSQLSYDDAHTTTPSINFFLNANKEDLNNEGLSLSGDISHQLPSSVHLPPSTSRRKTIGYLSYKSDIGSVAGGDGMDESFTTKGYSRASSKYTTDSPRILELREKKRLMEYSVERRHRIFPALIEVQKRH